MDNTKNNSKNQFEEENPLKHVDDFKKICHNMFKNFLDQNLCTIVDDVYKKFSDKLNSETGNIKKNEIKEDLKNMVDNTLNDAIEKNANQLLNSQNLNFTKSKFFKNISIIKFIFVI